MGPQYSHSSGTVLVILCTCLLFSFANRTAGSIAFGIEKHKMSAIWAIGEGIANLALSIILVHWYGIYGVAIGTMVPSLVVHLVLWPGYISKLVGLSYSEVVWKVWAPVFLSSIPFADCHIRRECSISCAQSHGLLPPGDRIIANFFYHDWVGVSDLCSQPDIP